MNTKHTEDQFVNIVKVTKAINKPNMKSTIILAAKFAVQLNQSTENS